MTKVRLEKFGDNQVPRDEDYGTESTIFHNLVHIYKDFRRVYKSKDDPPHISMIYLRNALRLLGIMPEFWKGESLRYRVIFILAVTNSMVMAAAVTNHLQDSYQDILLLGEDLTFVIGIYLIVSKIFLNAYYSKDIELLILQFVVLDKYFGQLRKSPNLSKIRKWQRFFYFAELTIFAFYNVVVILMMLAFCVTPILTQSDTFPCPSKFPYVRSYSEDPILFASLYIYEFIMVSFGLHSLLVIDTLGCHMFNQTTLNLKILCIRIRELGLQPNEDNMEELIQAIKFHQLIIKLVAKINHVYHFQYFIQMVASTFIICLTTFEYMLAKDEILLAMKFIIFAIGAFCQIFTWCWTGNIVYYSSLEVAKAAFEVERWYEKSPAFKQCLGFLIFRAQKPLSFQPKPFFIYNFDLFIAILKTSYSYFTVLNTMHD